MAPGLRAAVRDAGMALAAQHKTQDAHFIRAAAFRRLGRTAESAHDAAAVLAAAPSYTPLLGDDRGEWLRKLASSLFDDADDATIIEQLRANPLSLSRVPRHRITTEMVATAVTADEAAVAFVPKRFMTEDLDVAAVTLREKSIERVPADLRTRVETKVKARRNAGESRTRRAEEP